MKNKMKEQWLRAFRIENNEITQSNSGILNNLATELNGSKVENRRMRLNKEDVKCEEDLIADFNGNEQNLISGVVLRVTHAEDVPNIPDEFLQHEKISINELDAVVTGNSLIGKEHYYFLLDNSFVITNLQRNITITRFQAYINWLLEKKRGTTLYEFTPIIKLQEEILLSDIDKIIMKDPSVGKNEEKSDTGHKKFKLNLNDIPNIFSDVVSLDEMIENNIISAELLISFKKPRKMSMDYYQRMLGAYMKPISDTDNISFNTKKHGKIKGSDINRVKFVEIELTETGKMNEPQLYQEMEKFLNELKGETYN
jgi:hypothetical protein